MWVVKSKRKGEQKGNPKQKSSPNESWIREGKLRNKERRLVGKK